MRSLSVLGALTYTLLCGVSPALADGGVPIKYRENVKRGLKWMVDKQNKRDGSWQAEGQGYPITMTAN